MIPTPIWPSEMLRAVRETTQKQQNVRIWLHQHESVGEQSVVVQHVCDAMASGEVIPGYKRASLSSTRPSKASIGPSTLISPGPHDTSFSKASTRAFGSYQSSSYQHQIIMLWSSCPIPGNVPFPRESRPCQKEHNLVRNNPTPTPTL